MWTNDSQLTDLRFGLLRMGAYGSPELGPLRPPRVDDPIHSARPRALPVRVMLWSGAIVAGSFAALIVSAIIVGVINAARLAH